MDTSTFDAVRHTLAKRALTAWGTVLSKTLAGNGYEYLLAILQCPTSGARLLRVLIDAEPTIMRTVLCGSLDKLCPCVASQSMPRGLESLRVDSMLSRYISSVVHVHRTSLVQTYCASIDGYMAFRRDLDIHKIVEIVLYTPAPPWLIAICQVLHAALGDRSDFAYIVHSVLFLRGLVPLLCEPPVSAAKLQIGKYLNNIMNTPLAKLYHTMCELILATERTSEHALVQTDEQDNTLVDPRLLLDSHTHLCDVTAQLPSAMASPKLIRCHRNLIAYLQTALLSETSFAVMEHIRPMRYRESITFLDAHIGAVDDTVWLSPAIRAGTSVARMRDVAAYTQKRCASMDARVSNHARILECRWNLFFLAFHNSPALRTLVGDLVCNLRKLPHPKQTSNFVIRTSDSHDMVLLTEFAILSPKCHKLIGPERA